MIQIIDEQRPQSGLEKFMQMISSGLRGGAEGGQSIKQALGEKSEREALSDRFGDIFGKVGPNTRSQLLTGEIQKENQAAKLRGEYEADEESYGKIKNAFGKKFADVWLASPTGARTALTQAALEARARGIDLDKILSMPEVKDSIGLQSHAQAGQDQFKEPQEQEVFNELQQIKGGQDEGLLPEEAIARGKERYATGLKEYQEAGSKLQGMTRDKERFEILETLNKSDKLPKGLGRINVDLKEGNLILPSIASPEAERYVKTLNEFSSGAKDTFGSRVTNFDLAQYLKRFPTLLNTKEGRRQLLDQMKLVNQINSVYYKNLKKVYDDAGGVRKIDSDVAQRLAEKLTEPTVSKLSAKFREIGQFESRPNPAEFKGRKIRDKETGEVFVSDGNEWIPE